MSFKAKLLDFLSRLMYQKNVYLIVYHKKQEIDMSAKQTASSLRKNTARYNKFTNKQGPGATGLRNKMKAAGKSIGAKISFAGGKARVMSFGKGQG